MDLAQAFLAPQNTTHRQYEALRAYFVDGLPAAEVAQQFGYTAGSFYQLAHQFRQNPRRQFFAEPPRPGAKSSDTLRQQIVRLRKQNQSVYDISEALRKEGVTRSPVAVAEVLKQEGFAKLPRRRDEERPPGTKPTAADQADVRALNLDPRTLSTKFGGLFLFLPAMVALSFDRVIGKCGLPGSAKVPAAHALRSLLALKLFGTQRHTHVMSAVLDEGLALFAGLNVIPKRSFLTESSCRVSPACYPKLMRHWFDALSGLGLQHGSAVHDNYLPKLILHRLRNREIVRSCRTHRLLNGFVASISPLSRSWTSAADAVGRRPKQDLLGGAASAQSRRPRGYRIAPSGMGSKRLRIPISRLPAVKGSRGQDGRRAKTNNPI